MTPFWTGFRRAFSKCGDTSMAETSTTKEGPFSQLTDHKVIVALQVFNGRFIVATPGDLYEVKDGKLELMTLVMVEDSDDQPF